MFVSKLMWKYHLKEEFFQEKWDGKERFPVNMVIGLALNFPQEVSSDKICNEIGIL